MINQAEKKPVSGAAQTAAGAYLGYCGVKHGLPRALGIRIEYHTTSRENADLIKKTSNMLDPKFGGTGWAKKINYERYIENSKNFVHITGMHKNSSLIPNSVPNYIIAIVRPFRRKIQTLMYKLTGNISAAERREILKNNSRKENIKLIVKRAAGLLFFDRTKTFCIPGIDSYFNKKFIPDTDDLALKSSKPLKVFGNRFSAMLQGLKQFGLKGIKENKCRALAGAGIVSAGLFAGYKMIKNGAEKIFGNNKQSGNIGKI